MRDLVQEIIDRLAENDSHCSDCKRDTITKCEDCGNLFCFNCDQGECPDCGKNPMR